MSIEIVITPEMKATFASETAAHLDQFEQMLLLLEADPANSDALNSAFRAVHGIKGNSDYLGVKDINALAHALESLMDDLRRGKTAMAADMIPVLFEGLDALRQMNRRVTRDHYQSSDIGALLQKLRDFEAASLPASSDHATAKTAIDVNAVFANMANQHIQYLRSLADQAIAGNPPAEARHNALRILDTFSISARYAGHATMADEIAEMHRRLTEIAVWDASAAKDLRTHLAHVESQIQPADASDDPAQVNPDLTETVATEVLGRDLTLSTRHADELMRQVAELIIATNGLNHMADQLSHAAMADTIKTGVAAVNRVCRDLQTLTQQIRLVRLNSLFDRLPRIVRDLSRTFDKQIQITIMGGDTEIDRKVIEKLVDPMIHLIRNAVDHGIDPPADRVRQGKPARGAITVQARSEGHFILIDVIDDGRGIDPEQVRQTARQRHIMDADALAAMTPEAVINLIFMPGYSGATVQTAVSGRGVGLDIVRSNLKTIGGNVTLFSEPGQATRFRLHVPISMTVVDVLVVAVDTETFAIPMTGVIETLNILPARIQVANAIETMVYNEQVIGMVSLSAVLGLSAPSKIRQLPTHAALPTVITAHGGNLRGMVVDRIVGRESIIVKPLDRPLSDGHTFSGAALMGDGSIMLVLNPGALV